MNQSMKQTGNFGLVWFYGISTLLGYLMLNLFYTYIEYMIGKHILLITFFEWAWTFFVHN